MKTVWFVSGEDMEGTLFDTKLAAERFARMMFPDENESKRYSRIYYREVLTMDDLTVQGGVK